jgi:2-hydroxychromene-2-carboxylate isomerase
MHDAQLVHRAELELFDLVGLTASVGRDADQLVTDLETASTAHKMEADAETARLGGAAGTPTLFTNRVDHNGDNGPAALPAVVRRDGYKGRRMASSRASLW